MMATKPAPFTKPELKLLQASFISACALLVRPDEKGREILKALHAKLERHIEAAK